jgi:hypothetical protein
MNGCAENNSKEQKRAKGVWRSAFICSIVSGGRSVLSVLLDALRVSLAQKNDAGDRDIVPKKNSLHQLL